MPSPDDRRYAETHEWHQSKGGIVTLGLSQFAVDELTDITYVDFSKTEGPVQAGESFGEIESVKATSELYCGIDGVIVEVNEGVIDQPQIINQDPYGKGWLIKIQPSDESQLDALMNGPDYDRNSAS